jgi:pimeloyl-ACP methyl ester carboxylesterase
MSGARHLDQATAREHRRDLRRPGARGDRIVRPANHERRRLDTREALIDRIPDHLDEARDAALEDVQRVVDRLHDEQPGRLVDRVESQPTREARERASAAVDRRPDQHEASHPLRPPSSELDDDLAAERIREDQIRPREPRDIEPALEELREAPHRRPRTERIAPPEAGKVRNVDAALLREPTGGREEVAAGDADAVYQHDQWTTLVLGIPLAYTKAVDRSKARRETDGRTAVEQAFEHSLCFPRSRGGQTIVVVLEERACNVGGVQVRYRLHGEGPPALLVHGLGGSWRWWEPVVEPLGARFRIHLLDLPGFGSARGRPFVLGDAPSHVRAFLAAARIEPATLVGHSLGGAVCARAAALWPDVVERLVLVAPAGLLERRRPIQYALPIAAALRHARPSFLRVLAVDSLRAGAVTLYRAGTQLLGDDAFGDELASIRAPTLLVWGERDPVVPARLAGAYERAIPDVRLVVIPRAAHVPMAECPEQFARAVLDFASAMTA